jgi:hypothetical protein
MKGRADQYEDFVEHPRFGRGPRFTGLNPSPDDPDVYLGKASYAEMQVGSWTLWGRRIPRTAIVADTDRQQPCSVHVTHYFDLERRCRDCSRQFIFFAEEQKYWYEELGFYQSADAVRCPECRRKQHGLERQRELYETLYHVANRTVEQNLQMAEACLALIEAEAFTRKQTQHVRQLLNCIAKDAPVRQEPRFVDLMNRLIEVERVTAT